MSLRPRFLFILASIGACDTGDNSHPAKSRSPASVSGNGALAVAAAPEGSSGLTGWDFFLRRDFEPTNYLGSVRLDSSRLRVAFYRNDGSTALLLDSLAGGTLGPDEVLTFGCEPGIDEGNWNWTLAITGDPEPGSNPRAAWRFDTLTASIVAVDRPEALSCRRTGYDLTPEGWFFLAECGDPRSVGVYVIPHDGTRYTMPASNLLREGSRTVWSDSSHAAWMPPYLGARTARFGNDLLIETYHDDCVDLLTRHLLLIRDGELLTRQRVWTSHWEDGFFAAADTLMYWSEWFCHPENDDRPGDASYVYALPPDSSTFVRLDRPVEAYCEEPPDEHFLQFDEPDALPRFQFPDRNIGEAQTAWPRSVRDTIDPVVLGHRLSEYRNREYGVGVVVYPIMETDGLRGVVYTAPKLDADTLATFGDRSLCIRGRAECIFVYDRTIEYAYEVASWAILGFSSDSSWAQVSLDPFGEDSVEEGWVPLLDDGVTYLLWRDELPRHSLFFQWPDSVRFFEGPAPDAPLDVPLAPGSSVDRYDYVLRPLERDGDWLRVEVLSPRGGCAYPNPSMVEADTAWIRYVDSTGRPRSFWHTRGC